jgi:YD repeat-containing protein
MVRTGNLTTSYTYNGDGLRTMKTDSDKNPTHYTYNPPTSVPKRSSPTNIDELSCEVGWGSDGR